MDNDHAVPLTNVITVALWTWVTALLIAAWATWLLGGAEGIAYLLGLTACASSAAAATAHVRVYSLRVCAVIKAQRAAQQAELRSMR